LAALALLRLLIERPLGGGLALAWPEGVLFQLRIGAILTAAVVGASLGVSGAQLQATLRNPLADPFILGVSAGAGLGVALAIAFGEGATSASLEAAAPSVVRRALEAGGLVGPASLGALAALLATQLLGSRRDGPDPLTLVLAGVVVSAMCGAATLFVQHLLPQAARGDLSTWMMGRIPESPDPWLLGAVGGLGALGLLAGVLAARTLDAATFGDDEARALGVRLGVLRAGMATSAGVLAAGSVAIAGPLAFVGLMAPHIARSLLGSQHRPLMVGAAVVGAGVLIAADVLRQAIDVGAGRIPVGVFTALAGGPLFLLLLQRWRGGT